MGDRTWIDFGADVEVGDAGGWWHDGVPWNVIGLFIKTDKAQRNRGWPDVGQVHSGGYGIY